MPSNIFESKKYELAAVLQTTMAKYLPPLFRVHRELIKRTESTDFRLICRIEDLAESMGYDPDELKTILQDLFFLRFIDCQIDVEKDAQCTIKVLVR